MRPVAFILLIAMMASCEQSDPGPVIKDQIAANLAGSGFFVVNEGNFTRGNGSVSFMSLDSSRMFNNIFHGANDRGPGDIPFSMLIKGDTGYLVVNNSGKIEMIDINTAKSLRTLTGLISPRYIAEVRNGIGYVSSLYSDSIAVIDLAYFVVKGYIDIGRSSEMMVVTEKHVFVASWSGDRVITMIDAENDSVKRTIPVVTEPESMALDKNGDIWILCSGGYMKEELPALIRINPTTGNIVSDLRFPSSAYPTSLIAGYNGDTLFYINGGIYRIPVSDADAIPGSPFIESGGRIFYKLGRQLENGDLLVTDANDYQRKGFVLRYGVEGNLKQSLEAGIIPGNMVLKGNYE